MSSATTPCATSCGRPVMRHDPAGAAIVVLLRSLKMYGMAQAAGDLMEQGAPAFDSAVPILSQLLKAETAEREVRSVAYQIKAARFPVYKDLSGFDFASSEINEALVRQLHRCEFIENADNVVLVGGPGTGKTHIGTFACLPAYIGPAWQRSPRYRRSMGGRESPPGQPRAPPEGRHDQRVVP